MPSETKGSSAVEALLKEKRKFAPPKEFGKRAAVNRPAVYRDAAKNPARFWERFAREEFKRGPAASGDMGDAALDARLSEPGGPYCMTSLLPMR